MRIKINADILKLKAQLFGHNHCVGFQAVDADHDLESKHDMRSSQF
jgi:hypothetical protein